MAVVIIGGAGLIGKPVTERVAGKGEAVVCADVDTAVEFADPGVTVTECDVTDPESVAEVMREYEPETVVDLAYIVGGDTLDDPSLALDVNVGGIDTVFGAAVESGVDRVVWASTVGVYGAQSLFPEGETVTEESAPPAAYTAPDDISYYGAMKQFNEYQALLYDGRGDTDIHTLRPSTVFGPRRDSGFPWLSDLVEDALDDDAHLPFAPDEALVLVYSDDVAGLFAELATAGSLDHRVYNSGGHRVTVRELAELVEEVTGGTVTWEEGGDPVTMVNRLSNDRIVEELGFDFTPMREAIEAYAEAVS